MFDRRIESLRVTLVIAFTLVVMPTNALAFTFTTINVPGATDTRAARINPKGDIVGITLVQIKFREGTTWTASEAVTRRKWPPGAMGTAILQAGWRSPDARAMRTVCSATWTASRGAREPRSGVERELQRFHGLTPSKDGASEPIWTVVRRHLHSRGHRPRLSTPPGSLHHHRRPWLDSNLGARYQPAG